MVPVLLPAADAARAQRPAPIAIPEDLLDGELLPTHKKQISDRIEWWAKAMQNARTEKEVLAARKGWEEDYRYYPNNNYRSQFAGLSAPHGMKLIASEDLSADDPLRTLRQVNTAMIFSQMPHLSAAAAMGSMVASNNAAIRYLGWKAYRGVRGPLLGGGKTGADKLLVALGQALQGETSPMVLAAVLGVMNLSDVDLPPNTKQTLQKQFLDAIQPAWDGFRAKVLGGKVEWIRALQNSAQTLGILGSEPALRNACLQRLVDLADSASRAYAKAQAVDAADKAAEQKASDLMEATRALLLDLEGSMRLISGVVKQPVKNALTGPNAPDRGAAVQIAVLDWIAALKDAGVDDPAEPKKPVK
jgi:hypothetical protein